MKKILNYLVALALVFVQLLPVANAASITINDSVIGQVYKAYKIFDVTNTGDSYAYSIESTNAWFSVVEDYAEEKGTISLTQVGDTEKYVVQRTETFDETNFAKDFAAYLNDYKDKEPVKIVAGEVKAEAGKETKIDGLAAGYYFVDSSLGALCILYTTDTDFRVFEKNAEPTIEKTQSKGSVSVGDEITYTITIKAGGAADTSYILHDKMTKGLTLKTDSFKIKVGNEEVEKTNYEIKTTGLVHTDCTFEIEFKKEYTATLKKDTVITVTYTAIVNEEAIEESSVTNTAQLQYGHTYSEETVPVTATNYDFELEKTDGTKPLDGAQFELYDAKTGGNKIELILVTENGETFYRPIKAGETAVAYIEAGSVSVKGLEAGTYYLEEIKAPDGYNQLTKRQEVNLNNGDTAIEVVNTTGSQLPSTGGMGTVLFIAIGSMMVLGFGVLLVTKLRLSKMSI